MKNKKIIDSFNKVNCQNKDIIFERIFFKKQFNFKYATVLATFLIAILFIQNHRPQDDTLPLSTKTDNSSIKAECIKDINDNCEEECTSECE